MANLDGAPAASESEAELDSGSGSERAPRASDETSVRASVAVRERRTGRPASAFLSVVAMVAAIGAFAVVPDTSSAQGRDAERLARALAAANSENWDRAVQIAGRPRSLPRDVIDWMRLRAGEGTTAEALEFLRRNGDWPGIPYLRRMAEETLEDATRAQVLEFFADSPPTTGKGALALARAQAESGRAAAARDTARRAWLAMPMDIDTHRAFLAEFPGAFAGAGSEGLHDRRLDEMLWGRHYASARATLPLASPGDRALGRARIALYRRTRGVDGLIAEVPAARRNDPGLAHARVDWRWSKGRESDAYALTLESDGSAATLGRPERWARMRRSMARTAQRDGAMETAYRLAARHHLDPQDSAADYAELEWLAGYIALRSLDRPSLALGHFRRLEDAVTSPISKGRAGYWLGRTLESLGRTDEARSAYARAARFQETFYGLLAAERIGRSYDKSIARDPAIQGLGLTPVQASRVYRAGALLVEAGDLRLGGRFLTHLAESLSTREAARLARASRRLGEPYLELAIAKRVAQRGKTLNGAIFPMHPVAEMDHPVPAELVLAVARRESEFSSGARSGAGAIGLMQVLPSTGGRIARDLGVSGHSRSRMMTDWKYNARLGGEYLRRMGSRFDGNVVLAVAAYNAGPGRPANWVRRFGDPRLGEIDVVDWIESIPFAETRNYVMRVTESLPAYRARLGKDPLPVPFSRELAGATLRVR